MLFLDLRGIEPYPDLRPDVAPDTDNEDYEQLLRRGLESSRREKGDEHAETLAHLAALAVHLEKRGKSAEAAEFQREHDALAAQLAEKEPAQTG